MSSNFTLIVTISTCIFGFITVVVAYSQMRIASAKTKLELYERRFNIYVVALNCYHSVFRRQFEELLNYKNELDKSSSEAKFLFKDNDVVHEILVKMQSNFDLILMYEHTLMRYKSSNTNSLHLSTKIKMLKLEEQSDNAINDFKKNLDHLEEKLKPYIQFGNVKGWTFF